MYYMTKEKKQEIKKWSQITNAVKENYTPLKIIDLQYDENKGWLKTFAKVDPNIFLDSIYGSDNFEIKPFSARVENLDLKKITHCEHNVTGKRYKINQKSKIWQYNYNVKYNQELEQA